MCLPVSTSDPLLVRSIVRLGWLRRGRARSVVEATIPASSTSGHLLVGDLLNH